MERIGVRELRQHASRYLERVKAGETVEVTDRGRLVALLVPPTSATTARERLIEQGRLTAGRGPLVFPHRRAAAQRTDDVLAGLRAEG